MDILKAVLATAELTDTRLSKESAQILLLDVKQFDDDKVLNALKAIRINGLKLTVGNIIRNIDDGRPGVEEAWGIIGSLTEEISVLVTEEIQTAYGACYKLCNSGDMIGARMAFKEAYLTEIEKARTDGKPIKWIPSLGTNKTLRDELLLNAAKEGKITIAEARLKGCELNEMNALGDGKEIKQLENKKEICLDSAPIPTEIKEKMVALFKQKGLMSELKGEITC